MASPKHVGARVKKMYDPLFLTGRAAYVDDIRLPGMLHAAILRSPYAHAVIKKVDVEHALGHPGVAAVLTGEDVRRMTDPFPNFFRGFKGLRYSECYSLAAGKVRYAGEPVAAVAAADRYAAADALELISVEYEPLSPVVDAEDAVKPGSALLYEEWGDNLMFRFEVQGGDIDEAFREADYIIEGKVKIHRHTGTPIETRGYVADYEPATGSLTLWASTQQPHPLRSILAEVLRMPESRIRVIQAATGGSFGLKCPPYPEEPLICLLSMKTSRPVKWVEGRRESFTSTGHARQQSHRFEVAVAEDGRVLGLRDRMVVDLGVFFPQQGIMQMYVTAKHLPGPYKIRNLRVEARGVATNKTSYFAYRGFGKEAANTVYERVMDAVAESLGMDPIEVRLRNLIQPDEFPYESVTGAMYDSGHYPEALQKALGLVGYQRVREEQVALRREGRCMGVGVSCVLEPEGAASPASFMQGYDGSTVRVDPSGRVTVLTGITSPGTGNETGVAQVVADELGVSVEDVAVIQGDTAVCPYGLGNYSSRSMIVGASSAILAAREVKEKMVKVAAHMLEARPGDLQIEDYGIHVKGTPERRVTLKDVATAIYTDIYRLPPDIEPGLEATRYFLTPNVRHTPNEKGHINTYPTYSSAAHVAVVEVEAETGVVKILRYVVVHDCGVLVNPMFAEAQTHGGVAQGIGGTLYEELAYDEDGQLLTGTFMDYLVPKAVDIPGIEVEHQATRSPYTLLGSKGVGEGGTQGVSAAIANAVEDALKPFGVRVTETPLKPSAVWRLIRTAKRA